MVLHSHITFRLLALLASCTFMVSAAHAQAVAPGGDKASAVTPYRSAFEGYRPYTDDAMTNWKAANDTTARIGGWREYARQAQQPDNTPSPANKALETAPKPTTKAKP